MPLGCGPNFCWLRMIEWSLAMNRSLLTVSAVIEAGAGAALFTISLMCWFAGRDPGSRAAAGVVAALVFYNAAAVGILLYALLGMGLSGPGTLPAIILHGGLAAWCLACIARPAA